MSDMMGFKRGTCGTCMYWEMSQSECRLNPPQVIISAEGEVMSEFPQVRPNDGCSYWATAEYGDAGKMKSYLQRLQEGESDEPEKS